MVATKEARNSFLPLERTFQLCSKDWPAKLLWVPGLHSLLQCSLIRQTCAQCPQATHTVVPSSLALARVLHQEACGKESASTFEQLPVLISGHLKSRHQT